MSPIEGPEELTGEVRAHLANWLLSISDNKQLLGLRYAEWCTGAPELEADIAASAMAQYELGHARLLDGVLGDLPEDPRGAARDSEPASWANVGFLDRPFASWTELVAANALLDTLLTKNLESALAGRYQPLTQRLRKAVAEEEYHFIHAGAWFRRLATAPAGTVESLRAAVEAVWPHCVAWFGPPPGDEGLDALATAGVLDAGAGQLRDRWLDTVAPLFDETPLQLAAHSGDGGWRLDADVDWEAWNPKTRRLGTPDFDEASFTMLTGAQARAMGVSD